MSEREEKRNRPEEDERRENASRPSETPSQSEISSQPESLSQRQDAAEEKKSDPSRKPDLFDKLFTLPGLRWAGPIFARYREVLLYLFFGAVTTLVSFFVFWLFHDKLGWNEHPANLLSWVTAVLVAFLTNRAWVFADARAAHAGSFFLQIGEFYLSRVASLGAEEAILAVFVTWLGLPAMAVKAVASIVVVLLNYILSKFIVLLKKSNKK